MNYKRQNFRSLYCNLRESGVACVLQEFYSDFLRDCEDFKNGKLLNLMVIGPAGVGKSMSLRQETGFLKGVSSAVEMYRFLFENRNTPIILDDVETVLRNADVVTLLKALTDTSKPSVVGWNKQNQRFQELGVPNSFQTTSPVCILLNDASRYRNPDVQALLNRSRVIVFDPSPKEVLDYAISWWSDAYGVENLDIVWFCHEHLNRINQIDCRILFQALEEKKRGRDWQHFLLDQWSNPLDPESEMLKIVHEIVMNSEFNGPGARPREWHRRTGYKRNSWQKYWKLFSNLRGEPAQDRWDQICEYIPAIETNAFEGMWI